MVVDRPFCAVLAYFSTVRLLIRHVVRRAFERKGGDGGLNLAVTRIIGEIDLAVGIVEIESVALKTVFAQDLIQRLIVDEHAFGSIARRRRARVHSPCLRPRCDWPLATQ